MHIDHTIAFLDALAGRDTVYDWRLIHDVDRSRAGVSLRGTFEQVVGSLDQYNAAGYGVFIVVNETDGRGALTENVTAIRAHIVDVDSDADWTTWRALGQWDLPPSFFVVSSAGKYHAYWLMERYSDNARYEQLQRKLVTRWNSDPSVIDPPRVMRVPGSMHMKVPASPVIVQYVAGSGKRYSLGQIEWPLASVQAAGGGADTVELGAAGLAAPSFEWAKYALSKVDPNQLDRAEWIKLTAAFKQAAWSHADEASITNAWLEWCAQYQENDPGENNKQWRSIRQTKTGWGYLARVSGADADYKFGPASERVVTPMVPASGPVSGQPVIPTPQLRSGSALLTPQEQLNYFAGCVYVEMLDRILTPNMRFMGPGGFNASYGGYSFIITSDGKASDEPWKAATRGQVFQVPKVDHIRFIPTIEPGAVLEDELGRKGINVYRPANVVLEEGDASAFVTFLRVFLADELDVRIMLSYLAHCVQRPGVKARWAPVIQSMEGGGKGLISEALSYAVGSIYTYQPNAQLLSDSGSKFNAWMRNRLLIIANEIRTDDRRDMLEILKPLITEERIEVQGKGVDQDMEDMPANWIMFTNWKDAIPIKRDSRRYAIMYSKLQDVSDLAKYGVDGDYFPAMYKWLRADGKRVVAWFLKNYPIEPEFDPMVKAHRAPATSSLVEALAQSHGPIEQRIAEAVSEGWPGFRNGWLSSVMVKKMLDDAKIRYAPATLKNAYYNLGYFEIGRAPRAYFQEDGKQPGLYNLEKSAKVGDYARAQGYDV